MHTNIYIYIYYIMLHIIHIYIYIIFLAFRCCLITFRCYVCGLTPTQGNCTHFFRWFLQHSHALDFAFYGLQGWTKVHHVQCNLQSNEFMFLGFITVVLCVCAMIRIIVLHDIVLQWWCWTVCHWHCHAHTATLANSDPYLCFCHIL